MKTYKIVLKVNSSDFNGPPDWLIYEIRELLNKSKNEMTFASIEMVDE